MMREVDFDIWDPNNDVVVAVYEKDNYEIYDTGVDSDICYIFFSSHGLYYPNTREVFENVVIHKNRYEWKWVVKNSKVAQYAGRIIYVRDIYKQWYSRGINSRINTIDKTLDLLKRLTEGYRIITVGSSAGGYMAVLTAVKLNAVYCFNFSGQYQIPGDLNNPYYCLLDDLKDYRGNIFYFVPAYNDSDRQNYMSVQRAKCVKAFLFGEQKHASTMMASNMSYIIDRSELQMLELFKQYEGKIINKYQFLFQTVPFIQIVRIALWEGKGFVIRRIGKYWNDV